MVNKCYGVKKDAKGQGGMKLREGMGMMRHILLARLSVECLSHDEIEPFHTQASLNLANDVVLVSRYCRLAQEEEAGHIRVHSRLPGQGNHKEEEEVENAA